MGACCWANGVRAMTANLQVDYKRPLPLGSAAMAHAKLARREGRKCFLSATLTSLDQSTTFSTSTSLYVAPRQQQQQPP